VRRLRLAALLAVSWAGCAHQRAPASRAQAREGEHRYEVGRFAVIEKEDAFLDDTTILVGDARKRDEYLDLLKAAVPELFGGTYGVKLGLKLDSPRVATIEGYIAELDDAWREMCEVPPKEKRIELCSSPRPDHAAEKADWEAALRGHDALILRDVKKADP
jgi:hypothetical protein